MVNLDLTLARKINNRKLSSATWTSTTQHKFICPAGKRWFVLYGMISRDVSSTITVRVYDSSDAQILNLEEATAATGSSVWPNLSGLNEVDGGAYPIILDAGEYVSIGFGTAQSTVAWITCVVLEVDI